jgi:hypothetical protein
MITSVQKKIPVTDNLTGRYIEEELKKLGIDPLRWAIVEVGAQDYIVSVSYEI